MADDEESRNHNSQSYPGENGSPCKSNPDLKLIFILDECAHDNNVWKSQERSLKNSKFASKLIIFIDFLKSAAAGYRGITYFSL